MTSAEFKFFDPSSFKKRDGSILKPWSKVDGPGTSFTDLTKKLSVENIRGHESEFDTDISGFGVYAWPAREKLFVDERAVRDGYYSEVEALLRKKLPGIKKVVIFDHTIRRRDGNSPRQPVQQVHIDQTPGAAEARVRRHLPREEVDELLKGRYQIINVWRPIQNPASDFPLGVIDWRTTSPDDFVKVDLLYPSRENDRGIDDDRGKEVLPDPQSTDSTVGYDVKGETYAVKPNEKHRIHYVKDMTPDETMLIKCFDSRGQGLPNGVDGLARGAPHTAFFDPQTDPAAPKRQSIEVRCLVFYA